MQPGAAGDPLPALGHSLFDYVFAAGGRYEIPYPFERLVQRLEALVQPDALGNSGVKRVLIPLGRSLQRSAGAPEFFRFPRVVVAVDGEPREIDARAGPLLRDRLYIGYQEKAAVLEVISYNESAGRFEFQLVKDYRAGAAPRAFYANRGVCTACHQNAAPIFARQQWDETNANPRLQPPLAAYGRRRYGIEVARGVDEPYAIDNATDRANRIAPTQVLWRDGCGADDPAGTACRAAALRLMLQYRMSGASQLDREGDAYRKDYAPRITEEWRARWPGGLHVPDADLPNRDPVASMAPASSMSLDATHVPAQFDALLPRAALETWRASNPDDLDRLPRGLSELVAEPDIALLDRALRRSAATGSARELRARCTFKSKPAQAGAVRISFLCQPAPGGEALALQGRLHRRADRITRGSVERFQVGGAAALPVLAVTHGIGVEHNGGFRVSVALSRQGLSARTQRGERIERLELIGAADGTGEALAVLRDDFAQVAAALDRLAQRTQRGDTDALSSKPFRRAVVLPDLLGELGERVSRWCCVDDPGLPAPAVQAAGATEPARDSALSEPDELLVQFYSYCARCHRTADKAPPNFLAGERTVLRSQIAQCAPRIFARLGMWGVDPERRTKTPMPPELALNAHGMSPEAWRSSAALRTLRQGVAAILASENGQPPDLTAMLVPGYESLRPCLQH